MTRHTVKAHKLVLQLSVAGFIACASFGFSAVSLADSGEPELSFRPAKDWTVSADSIEIASAQVQNCKISNEFNNGFILGLQGSHKWVQSLSLDLRQAALEKGNIYDVSLNVPGVSSATVQGRASQANVLMVDLKGQKTLYQAMRDSAVLDISVEGNDFRFYMSNFAPAATQFERCMAGGDIKPITQETNEPLQASVSEDPFATFTTNESIALEEEARAATIAEIDPDDPKPVIQNIPYKETKKLGDKVIVEDTVTPSIPTEPMEDITDVTITTPPAEDTAQDNLNADKRSIAENAVENARPKPRKRITEMLAQEIQDNPDIAALDDETAASDLPSIEETTPDIEFFSEPDTAAAPPPAAPAPVTEIPSAPKPEPVVAKAPPASDAPVMAKELYIPPVIDDIPLDAAAEPADEPAQSAEAPALPEPESEVAAEEPKAMTAEDLNRQQLEKIAARQARSEGWKDTAKKNTSATTAAMATTTAGPENGPLQAIIEAETLTQDTATEEAPFSQKLEKVTALSDPSLKEEIVVETTPVAPAPEAEENAKEDALLPIQDVAEVKTVNVKTPDIVTKHKISKLEADFTGLDDMEPASAGSHATHRDPHIGRKISQLEQMINDLEIENTALKSELDATLEDTKQERMNISSDNWNLERATMRFNEAERQVKTLGQQLQRERTQCNLEKKELETMLFDPQVTNDAQLARLADLERKLQSCKGG